MRVIICGAGQVGTNIAEHLATEQHDVTIIDIQSQRISQIQNTLEVRALVGHGAHPDVLAQAGAAQADILIAVTLYDEVNMIACQVAHSLFNVPTKIARIRRGPYLQPQYQKLFSHDDVPVDVVISPEAEAGDMVLRRLALAPGVDILYFLDEEVVALAVQCIENCPILNTSLRELNALFPDLQSTVVSVEREGEIMLAKSSTQLRVGDLAYVLTPKDKVTRSLALFGYKEEHFSRLVIAGGGNIGLHVARGLEKRLEKSYVKLIESNQERAHLISDELPHTTVLHGSALDLALLQEAEIEKADLFLGLTNQDQVNVLSAIIAKRIGCKANMVLLNNSIYKTLGPKFGIDAYLDPRVLTVSRILQYMRAGRIRSIYSVANGAAELIESEVMPHSPLIGKALADLHLPEGIRIGAIYRKGEFIQPQGNSILRVQDCIVSCVLTRYYKDLAPFFHIHSGYL